MDINTWFAHRTAKADVSAAQTFTNGAFTNGENCVLVSDKANWIKIYAMTSIADTVADVDPLNYLLCFAFVIEWRTVERGPKGKQVACYWVDAQLCTLSKDWTAT
jgi:hypothetical protein